MTTSDLLTPAPPGFEWPRCPEADQFIKDKIARFLQGHALARSLSERMKEETSTEFQVWVDHLILPKRECEEAALGNLGFVPDKSVSTPSGTRLFWHPYADLPRLLFTSQPAAPSCSILVESVSDFQLAHGLSVPIQGTPYSTYREARIKGENGELRILERRGGQSLIPDLKNSAARYVQGLETWLNRKRNFRSREEGMNHTLRLAKRMVQSLGTGPAAWAFLEAERRYWQSRNRAAQIQKARQDKLGLGWANHDHHTFRSSRPVFPLLIQILKTFGFKKRERYYAGLEAGWGAQIMEQPQAQLVIFADVDLAAPEVSVDFSKVALPELAKPGTVGLWCSLHGESMLEAGLHHLEAQFNFDHLRDSLKKVSVNFMAPFSDFPHLRQAFSEGELWPVPLARLESLRSSNRLSEEAFDRIKRSGAVGSHLENLERKDGFKGFNQKGVSQIIREVNPEAQALKGSGPTS